MDKVQFWRRVEDAKAKSGGECAEQVELLEKALVKLPPEEIITGQEIPWTSTRAYGRVRRRVLRKYNSP